MQSGHPVTIEVLPDEAAVAARTAEIVGRHLVDHPHEALGLAIGRTFEPVYRALVALNGAGRAPFGQATTFNLDEYVGLARDDPDSFAAFMRRGLFDLVDLDPARAHLPDGSASDLAGEGRRYEALIAAAGGIGLQLLGIGANGHVGFNEPGSPLDSRTREVVLAPETRRRNQPTFPPGRAVPERALTMGLGTILEARELLLVATGGAKAPALAAALERPVSPDCPASALRLHPRVRVVADAAAAQDLRRTA